MQSERTLVLVKPDGVQRGMVGDVISRFEKRGLKIVGLKILIMDENLAGRHYAVHESKPFFPGLVKFITSGPLVAAVLEGPRAVELVRATMGQTDPIKANPGTIRGDLALDMGHNIVHGSDSVENAKNEIDLFFRKEEVVGYRMDMDTWVRES